MYLLIQFIYPESTNNLELKKCVAAECAGRKVLVETLISFGNRKLIIFNNIFQQFSFDHLWTMGYSPII